MFSINQNSYAPPITGGVCWEALAGASLELVLELFIVRRARL